MDYNVFLSPSLPLSLSLATVDCSYSSEERMEHTHCGCSIITAALDDAWVQWLPVL